MLPTNKSDPSALAQQGQDESFKALQESEERYRSLVIAISEIVWITDAEGRVNNMPAWRAYTGQSVAQVKGWSWIDAVHPEDRGAFSKAPYSPSGILRQGHRTAQIWQNAVLTKSSHNTEYRIRAADGSY